MSDMAEVLAKHGIWGYNGSEIACKCNRRNWISETGYAAHQAAALSAAGFGPVQELRGVLEKLALADAWDQGMTHGHNTEGRLLDKWAANPYRQESSS